MRRWGPRQRRVAALSVTEEAMVVELRRRTLLPLDDVLGSLRENLPRLSRSALHRCLVRHGISRLPAGDPAAKRKRFAPTSIGYVHIDACELQLPRVRCISSWRLTASPSSSSWNCTCAPRV